MAFLEFIKNLLTYKEPLQTGRFELHESPGENPQGADLNIPVESGNIPGDPAQGSSTAGDSTGEGSGDSKEATEDSQNNTSNQSEDKKAGIKKSPKSLGKWNKDRKQESSRTKDLPQDLPQHTPQGSSQNQNSPQTRGSSQTQKSDAVNKNLSKNLQRMQQDFNMPENADIVIRNIKAGASTDAFILYVDGMVDKVTINESILSPLMQTDQGTESNKEPSADHILESVLSVNDIQKSTSYTEIIQKVLEGVTALFVDGLDICFLIETQGFEKRNVEQPVTERTIFGPHEAFSESLATNITLIRRIIKNKDLITETLPIGRSNNLKCAIMYMKGIVNPGLVQETKRRIQSIDTDYILGGGELNQYIEDHNLSLLPQILSTERPDRTAPLIMDGRVAILYESSPNASIVPTNFFELIYSPDDFFIRWQYGTFVRAIRYMALMLSLFLPGIYLAITQYHAEAIPTELILAIEKSRENVPFGVIFEILLMEVSFELIREAGVRVPEMVGQTLGIVGALILGQSAVAANLVSPILVIIVAITGLGNFAMPNHHLAIGVRVLRFLFILLGALMGFYGITFGIIIVAGFAVHMKSFGVPFFVPIAPKTQSNLETFIRLPLWISTIRTDSINTLNRRSAGRIVRRWKGRRGE
ncbi:MAG: spore germination protein [Clostridiales bacterium]|nr:spore germination protein [Clostridiales bacterium]